MPVRDSLLVNYVLYQVSWFACVLGAAWHRPWAGFGVGLLLLVAHFVLSSRPGRDLKLVIVAVVAGLIVELMLIATGTYRFTSGTVVASLPPPWLLLMWAQFATTFPFSLKPIVMKPVAAALFGAIGGPLAFVAGQGLGAVTLLPPVSLSLLRLAVGWGIAMTVLSAVARAEMRGEDSLRSPDIGMSRP